MLGLAVGLLLIASLLIVNIWIRTAPLNPNAPLNVDESLPLPWAGQASSVCSLTALFGAYFGILVILGIPALLGLAGGGAAGLVYLRSVVINSKASTFDQFLSTRRFALSPQHNDVYILLMVATQLGFAASELSILHDLAVHAFSMAPKHATVFAVATALISYLYCLVGGYGALFRTDIIQFCFLLLMCVTIFVAGSAASNSFDLLHPLAVAYWTFGDGATNAPRAHVVNCLFGFLIGACYMVTNPDTWKRVFVSSLFKGSGSRSFRLLLFAGAVPFLLLIPSALLLPKSTLSTIGPFDVFLFASRSRFLLMAVTLGMVSTFLSSTSGSLISAVHLLVIRSRSHRVAGQREIANYHYIFGMCFIVIVAGALVDIAGLGNSYFIAAYLLGPYAILGGTIIGSQGMSVPVRTKHFPWLILATLVVWFVYLVQMKDVLEQPTPELLKAFPPGMMIFALFFLYSRISGRGTR
jgi:hypothetical protein